MCTPWLLEGLEVAGPMEDRWRWLSLLVRTALLYLTSSAPCMAEVVSGKIPEARDAAGELAIDEAV